MQRQLFFDELGNPIEFMVKAKFQLNDTSYVAMLPAEELDSDIYILKIDLNENGEEILVGIDDDELAEAAEVYEELMQKRMQ